MNQHPKITRRQRKLLKWKGTPAQFAVALQLLPAGAVSPELKKAAIERYNREWKDGKV